MTPHADPLPTPYKGTDSFQVEDRELFFGREREAATLAAKVLSARCTLLYARSGVGKTSLLNARVIPTLEAKGWTPVQVRLDRSPVESVRLNTFRWMLPPPATEVAALEAARAALCVPGEDPTLLELLARYDRLPVSAPDRRRLIAPVALAEQRRPLGQPTSGDAIPYFTRLLRRSIDPTRYAEHVRLVGSFGRPEVARAATGAAVGDAHVDGVLAVLRDEAYQAAYDELLAELNGPVGGLAGFFRNVVERWGRLHANFGLVLLIDQFEELFTLFTDSRLVSEDDAHARPSWHLRREFLEELEAVYTERRGDRGTGLPVRLVISMREEFIAQLDPVRRFMPELDDSAFHLGLLDLASAEDAILVPAGCFGVSYHDAARDAILKSLAVEEQFITPVTLQIVCDKLWQEMRREAWAAEAAGAALPPPEITAEHIARLGGERGVPGILESFFDDFLAALGDPESQRTALDLLTPLITSGRTRNIVLRDELVRQRYRDAELRERVMERLVRGGVVRVERRHGSEFAEIMHEFLIGPVLKQIRDTLGRDPAYHRLQYALRALRRVEERGLDDDAVLLRRDELEDVRASAPWLRLAGVAPALLLRSALRVGDQFDDFRGVLDFCGALFADGGSEPDVGALVQDLEERVNQGRWLRADELATLNRHRVGLTLTPSQIRFVWHSELYRAGEGEENDVRFWTGEVARHVPHAS